MRRWFLKYNKLLKIFVFTFLLSTFFLKLCFSAVFLDDVIKYTIKDSKYVFTSKNLLWFSIGCGISYAMIPTGIDSAVQDFFRREPYADYVHTYGAHLGSYGHLVFGLGLYSYGEVTHNKKLIYTAEKLYEALLINGVLTFVLKNAIGRLGPAIGGPADFEPLPYVYDWLSQRTVWPSGHTSSMFAGATVLSRIYDDKVWVKYVSYTLALFVAASQIDRNVHWFSDCIGGAFLGYLVGKSVVRKDEQIAKTNFLVLPLQDKDYVGVKTILLF